MCIYNGWLMLRLQPHVQSVLPSPDLICLSDLAYCLHSLLWSVLERRTSQKVVLSRLWWRQMTAWVWVYFSYHLQYDCKSRIFSQDINPPPPKLHPTTNFMSFRLYSPLLLPANRRQYHTTNSWDFGMQHLRPQWNETTELSPVAYQWHVPYAVPKP